MLSASSSEIAPLSPPAGRPATLRERLLALWHGPPELTPQQRLERRLIANRYLSLALLLPMLPLLSLSTQQIGAAYGVLMVAALYNIWIHWLHRRRSSLLDQGYITTVGDGSLCLALVLIGGGFHSSFYFLLIVMTLAAAMRYGYGPSLIMVALYVVIDAATLGAYHTPALLLNGDFLFRTSFSVLTALLASYLWDQATVAESALAVQLRRARALNESGRALNASLELDVVLHTVREQARKLLDADAVLLQLNAEFNAATRHAPHTLQSNDRAAHTHELQTLINQTVRAGSVTPQCGVLGNDASYVVMPLPMRSVIAGYVAVLRTSRVSLASASEHELIHAFTERAALALEHAWLYKTLGERSADLQQAYTALATTHQELLGIDEMKTNFIANVSHELRTPLTSIRSFSELLLSYDVDHGTRQEFLQIINAESARLTRLINDVLDITKIEAGQVAWNMQTTDLCDLLQISARSFRSLAENKKLRFECQVPPEPIHVWIDGDRIQQVVANLIGNAMKFTTEGGITVRAAIHNDEVRVHVHDTGIGIPPEEHERIFEKFHQVGDTLTDKPPGTGLGLCICRDIVEHHGGRIWVSSDPGAGSTFTFTLPLPSHTTGAS